ncbi:MAG: hypothetical protein QHJ34_09725 [bacterium]|jgi:hypothetical protein|nr:hypothetical protein [candidate division KSB1 bacterium]MDH7560496.1 hypothetical protein [bacterium]
MRRGIGKGILLGAVAAFVGCQVDHGLYPVDYEIRGNVIFFAGQPPANTDRVEVFALKEFPPKDPQNLLYAGQSGALNYSIGDSVPYAIQVSPTSYELAGVVWKEKGSGWNLTGLMGIYTGSLHSFLPATVQVSKENPVAEGIDIYANWEVVTKDAAISGRIRYAGEWPAQTSMVLLAVYRVKPTSEFQHFLFENVDYSQPVFVDSSSYRLRVSAGGYNYVVLFWVPKKMSSLADLVTLGFYADPAEPARPGTVIVSSGGQARDVDIQVDFSGVTFP